MHGTFSDLQTGCTGILLGSWCLESLPLSSTCLEILWDCFDIMHMNIALVT